MVDDSPKFFAVIPAAGRSTRMGQPKLLLPWRGGRVIDSVLAAWTESGIARVLIVVRADDAALIRTCRSWPVTVVQLEQTTRDMKGSMIAGLDHIRREFSPEDNDQVFLAPADLPRLSVDVIRCLMDVDASDRLVVPFFDGKSGHPLRMPWQWVRRVESLGANEGLNSLLGQDGVLRLDLDPRLRAQDIDTPDDFDREKNAGE